MDSINIPCRQCPVLPMCKHKLTVECVHLYDYLLSVRGIKSIDKNGLKIVTDVFNNTCTRVTCYSYNSTYITHHHYSKKSIFIDFENGRVLMVERGCNDEK